jgi:GR25 family glycosyltransferase involved in LPS biosynthesis
MLNSFEKIYKSPAFVLHIERYTDRKSDFMKNIGDAGFHDIRIFTGVDGHVDTELKKAGIELNIPNFDDIFFMHKGNCGCTLSHLKVWKHIIDNNIPVATVFEDDVHFHPQWKELSNEYWNETPKDFDILFIGNSLDSTRFEKTNSTTEKVSTESCFCTHAYVITLDGAKNLLNLMSRWNYSNYKRDSGEAYNGLVTIDIMIKLYQMDILSGKLSPLFKWYCWNGTYFPCAFNSLPLKECHVYNSGLVFQNIAKFGYCDQIEN